MEKAMVTTIELIDCNKIETLYERILSLNNLILLFADREDIYSKDNHMYEKILEDMRITRKNFDNWWDFAIQKYGLEEFKKQKLSVNFIDNSIVYLK